MLMSAPTSARLKILLFVLPLLLAMFFMTLKIWSPETYLDLIQEDSILENMQAATYFVAFLFALYIAWQLLHQELIIISICYMILALGFMFICLEEISWGQRIFHLHTPQYFVQHNHQREISVHNLYPIQTWLHEIYMLVCLYGGLAFLILPRIGIKSPLLRKLYAPEWFLSLYFLLVFLVYFTLDKMTVLAYERLGVKFMRLGYFLLWRDQEPAELLLALGMLLFVVHNTLRIKNIKAEPDQRALE